MGMAEPSLQNGQLLQDHWSTRSMHANLVPLCDVVDPLGHFCFLAMQLLLREAWQPALLGVPLQKL